MVWCLMIWQSCDETEVLKPNCLSLVSSGVFCFVFVFTSLVQKVQVQTLRKIFLFFLLSVNQFLPKSSFIQNRIPPFFALKFIISCVKMFCIFYYVNMTIMGINTEKILLTLFDFKKRLMLYFLNENYQPKIFNQECQKLFLG